MSFQWLQLRIQEERDRRQKETITLERLPSALKELHGVLNEGIATYTRAFGAESVNMSLLPSCIRITTPAVQAKVAIAPEVPGFRIERGEVSLEVRVGL